MKVRVDDISPTMTISISGNEPWLDKIYQAFPVPAKEGKPLLSGEIVLHNLGEGDAISAVGQFSYAPFVDCSRCADKINWPMAIPVVAQFVRVDAQDTPEAALDSTAISVDDSNLYSIAADRTVNIEPLINDLLQLEMPLQTVRKSDDANSCLVCGISLENDVVFADNPAPKSNPFDVLKGFSTAKN